MSFSALSELVWARKLTFCLVFALIMGGAIAFCFLVTPIFQSTAMLMISQGRLQKQQAQFPDTIRYQLNSQIYIIESEDVLRQAIAQIGPQKLFPNRHANFLPAAMSFSPLPAQLLPENLWRFLSGPAHPQGSDRSDLDVALLEVRKRLAVGAEKDSQVLSLKFRHEDPLIAEQFLQLVVNGFIQRQADLSGNAEAPSFFREQASRYREDYSTASTKLSEFAQKHSTYSINQEIELALARRDDISSALAKTRGSIAEKEAQAGTFQNTLTQLRRRISLPAEITGPKRTSPPTDDALTDANKVPSNESPLLLVRVFQETAQSLVNLNSAIVGLRALETQQKESLANIEQKLAELSSVQAEFDRLKSEVAQASKILEAHVGRAAEAQMDADWDASEKLSSVKVVQAATTPIKPVFPPKPLIISLAAAVGLAGAGAASVAMEAIRPRRKRFNQWVPANREFEHPAERLRNAPRREQWIPSQEFADRGYRRG